MPKMYPKVCVALSIILSIQQNHREHPLKLSQLQAFVSVADHHSFSAAALELGLSQSTISHAIASLEEELDIVLLVRGRHGAVLTTEGEQILKDARQVLCSLAAMQQKARSMKGFQSGQVRIATVRSIATHILPQIIAQFRQKYPNMNVTVMEFDRYVEVEQVLKDGRADVGFTALPTSTEFETWELFRDEFVALLPPGTLNESDSLTWERLVQFSMILNYRSQQHNKAIREHVMQCGYTLKLENDEVREDSTLISMVRQGLGATIIARLAAEPIPVDIQVRSLPIQLERIIGVAILANGLLPRSVFAFLDLLKANKVKASKGKQD